MVVAVLIFAVLTPLQRETHTHTHTHSLSFFLSLYIYDKIVTDIRSCISHSDIPNNEISHSVWITMHKEYKSLPMEHPPWY